MSDLNRVLIELGYDTSKLAAGAKEVLQQTQVLNKQLQYQGEQAGKGMGDKISKGLKESGEKLNRVAMLAGMSVGLFMGEAAGNTFKSTMQKTITGAMGGMMPGLMMGNPMLAIGGALLGGAVGFAGAMSEQNKALDDLSSKFGLARTEIEKLINLYPDEGMDGVKQRLDGWKRSMDAIIQRKPEMMALLKELNLSSSDLVGLGPTGLNQKLANDIASNTGIGDKVIKAREEYNKKIAANQLPYTNPVDMISREFKWLFSGGMMGKELVNRQYGSNYKFGVDDFNTMFEQLSPEQQQKLERQISSGGMTREDFVKNYNNYTTAANTDKFSQTTFKRLDEEAKLKQEKEIYDIYQKRNELELKSKAIADQIVAKQKELDNLDDDEKKIKMVKGRAKDLEEGKKLAELELKRVETEKELRDLQKQQTEQQQRQKDLEDQKTEKLKEQAKLQKDKDNYAFNRTDWKSEDIANLSLPWETEKWNPLKILGPGSRAGMQAVMMARNAKNLDTWALKARLENNQGLAGMFSQQAIDIRSKMEQLGISERNPTKQITDSIFQVRREIGKLNEKIDAGIRIASGA